MPPPAETATHSSLGLHHEFVGSHTGAGYLSKAALGRGSSGATTCRDCYYSYLGLHHDTISLRVRIALGTLPGCRLSNFIETMIQGGVGRGARRGTYIDPALQNIL